MLTDKNVLNIFVNIEFAPVHDVISYYKLLFVQYSVLRRLGKGTLCRKHDLKLVYMFNTLTNT